MTTYAAPASLTGNAPTPTPPTPPNRQANGSQRPSRPRRSGIGTAIVALVITAAAAVGSATSLAHHAAPAHIVVVPPAKPTYTPEEIQQAKTTACHAWRTAAFTVIKTTNATNAAPANWDDPLTRAAIANEARTAVSQIAYLRTQIHPATPADLAGKMNSFMAAAIDISHAEIHEGDANPAIHMERDLKRQLVADCGF